MSNKSLEKAINEALKVLETEEERVLVRELGRQFDAVWGKVDDHKNQSERSLSAIERSQIAQLNIQEEFRTFFNDSLLKQLKWIVGSLVTLLSIFTAIIIAFTG